MKKLLLIILLVIAVVIPAAAQEGTFPRTLTDALGTEVTIDAPPQRIVSLSLAADETLLPILGPERFAAVTALSQDPGISNVAVLANQVENAIVSSDDTEQIIALAPDLVIAASFTAPETIQQMRDAGLTVFTTDFAVGLDAVRANIRQLGELVGEEAAAEAVIAQMDAQIEAVQAGAGEVEAQPRVLYLTPGNYTSGTDSTIAEIIALAGGVDASAEAGLGQFAAVSDEFIIEADPDVILLTGWTPYDPTFVDTFTTNPAFANLSAIRNGRVYIANDAHLTSVSQFVSEGVEDVAAILWSQRYPAPPLSVTDANGQAITLSAVPDTLIIVGERAEDAVNRVLEAAGEAPYDILNADLEDSGLSAPGNAVFFTDVPDDQLPEVSATGFVTVVALYPGDTPAEVVENIEIVGDALGERLAALNAIAAYMDGIEGGTE